MLQVKTGFLLVHYKILSLFHFSSASTQSGEGFLKLMGAMEREEESKQNRMQCLFGLS